MGGSVPVFGVTGASGSGKTTVLEALVGELRRRGWRVAVLKHAPGGFEFDRPGKDSWRFASAGAEAVLVHSDREFALLGRTQAPPDPLRAAAALAEFCRALGQPPPDLVLVEGHHGLDVPSVHVEAPGLHRPPGPRCLGVVSGPAERERLADLVEQALHLGRPREEPAP